MNFPVSIIEVLLFLILCVLLFHFNKVEFLKDHDDSIMQIILIYAFIMLLIFIMTIVVYYVLNFIVLISFAITGIDFWGQR